MNGKPSAYSTALSLCKRMGVPFHHACTLQLLGEACLMRWHAIVTTLIESGEGVPEWLAQRIVESSCKVSVDTER